ncbi:MAG: hypothetical protein QXG39_10080 [Candidatus Aenigmatarchaeota archaeon]
MSGKEILVNLTPHEIVVYDSSGQNILFKIPPSGTVARVSTFQQKVGELNGIPIYKTTYGKVENLPNPQPGVVYIVSILVLQALAGSRSDIVAPDTGSGAVRDASGKIIGTKSFIVL